MVVEMDVKSVNTEASTQPHLYVKCDYRYLTNGLTSLSMSDRNSTKFRPSMHLPHIIESSAGILISLAFFRLFTSHVFWLSHTQSLRTPFVF